MVLFRTAHLLRLNLVTFMLFLPSSSLYGCWWNGSYALSCPESSASGAGFRIDRRTRR